MHILDIVLHLDRYLAQWSQDYGTGLYILLFFILFAETGLVFTPILPGDSLLFAVGAMTSLESGGLSFGTVSVLLFLGVFLGDNTNYFIGKKIGRSLFQSNKIKFLNESHLKKAEHFYSRHGNRAIILARFIPIVRTFVPFVAGIGVMPYRKFLVFSLIGSVLWIQLFLWAGRLFGRLPQVQSQFHYVIIGVIAVSLLPLAVAWFRGRNKGTVVH